MRMEKGAILAAMNAQQADTSAEADRLLAEAGASVAVVNANAAKLEKLAATVSGVTIVNGAIQVNFSTTMPGPAKKSAASDVEAMKILDELDELIDGATR